MRSFILGLLFLSGLTFAQEFNVDVMGRSYVYSCGYYSNESGDFSLNLTGWSLPWGARVFVVYGWKGYNVNGGGPNANQSGFDWAYKNEVEAGSVAPYRWGTTVHQVLHERTSNQFLSDLQFVFRVEVPGRAPYYMPRTGSWSFYQISVGQRGNSPCVDSSGLPDMHPIQQTIVER